MLNLASRRCNQAHCCNLIYARILVRRIRVIRIRPDQYRTVILLLFLTAAALLVHGYHPYAEDAEIYLPGVERILNPALFPVGQEFIRAHSSMTVFPNLVAFSLRVTHLPFELGLFAWHIASIFLLLAACWHLSGLLFGNARAQLGSACMLAALLTLPVAGTALYIDDQYLNPRNLAAFSSVFAVTGLLRKSYLHALAWIVFAACVHPLMWVFPFSFGALWLVMEYIERRRTVRQPIEQGTAALGFFFMLGIQLAPANSAAYHESARLHSYFYIQEWQWYEWLGIVAPLALLWWFGRIARARQKLLLARACRAFALYGVIYFVVALIVDLPASFETLARIQPLRNLHLLYMFLFVCIGGFLGEYVLKDRVSRWLALFVPLSIGMFAAQRSLFPASSHIELPGRPPRNPWGQAFVWIRNNTARDAIFALDPAYMQLPGEDETGFRCRTQRSRLADRIRDGGVVSMFPALADEWWKQVQAQSPWRNLGLADFAGLKRDYGVSWLVVQQPGVAGLECPYENSAVRVCRAP